MSAVIDELPAFRLDVPLRTDEQGGIRIGNTRIQLESLVWLIRRGETVEQMMQGYPTLTAADIHAVVAWCLANRDEVDAYMARREREANELQQNIEQALGSNEDLKAKLRERMTKRGPA